nr:MAG TPA: hypothetical protein [Bacteriophage sp.]DAY09817.1 MAG TPA: hypothetical protein [Caudoviricetes sp.]
MIGVQLTTHSWRSLFRCVVYRSLAPIFERYISVLFLNLQICRFKF